MAFESEQDETTQDTGESAVQDDGTDLSDVLGNQDTTYMTGEKKPVNAGMLILAGFVLAAGFGTYVMYSRTTPAAVLPTAEAKAAQTTISSFLKNDKANAARMRDLLQNTEKAVDQFRASPGKKQVPVDELQTNPFRLDSAEARAEEESVDEATTKKREAEERAATLKAAQGLSLQFVVSGKKKSCLINNAKYTEGETVGVFVIDSIGTNSVVVSKGDARFELKMKATK